MLFVDHPEEFHRFLPGFLPRNPPVAGGTRSVADKPLALALRDTLYGPGGSHLGTADLPAGGRNDFWTSYYLVHHAPVSQYDILRKVIAERQTLPENVVCLALSGAGFHGQSDRSWSAEKGNLHLSVGLRCDLGAADCGLALTMLPAVAVLDALSDLYGFGTRPGDLGIKWVNDILAGGRKVGGVLTSARSWNGRIQWVVLGIGLNVGVAPPIPATPFTPGVTCLKDWMPTPADGLTKVLRLILASVAGRFEQLVGQGPGPLLEAYRAGSLVLGRMVEIRPDGPSAASGRQGRVLAIGSDLALTLSDGPDPVTTGRLVLVTDDETRNPSGIS